MDDLTLDDVARLLGERDLVIAKLQKELARLRAELERLHGTPEG